MMSYKDNRYRDTYTHTDTEPSITVNPPTYLYRIVEKVELTDECIQKIAERVVELIKDEKAEVEPVRHGKWIEINTEYVDQVKCSECGFVEFFNKGWAWFNYCPICGAKMDEQD